MKKSSSQKEASLFSNLPIKSSLFYKNNYDNIGNDLLVYLNTLSKEELGMLESSRSPLNKIPIKLKNYFNTTLSPYCNQIVFQTSKKKKAHAILNGKDGLTYYLKIVTHNVKTSFNMPDITSVDILKELYRDNQNIFIVLLLDYDPTKTKNYFVKTYFLPIEFLSWDCLTIGALGSGQIQIRKASYISIKKENSRKLWMQEFILRLIEFYKKENIKLGKRLAIANNFKIEWEAKEDIWS